MTKKSDDKIFNKSITSIRDMLKTEPQPVEMIIPGVIPKTSVIIISAPGGYFEELFVFAACRQSGC